MIIFTDKIKLSAIYETKHGQVDYNGNISPKMKEIFYKQLCHKGFKNPTKKTNQRKKNISLTNHPV